MKKYLKEFVHRGVLAAWAGPLVLAVIYAGSAFAAAAPELSYIAACKGVVSMTLMAFIAGGISSIYTVERLPLISSILIHGAVLYLDYLMMYTVNDWLPRNGAALGIFTAVFVAGFAIIWVFIYFLTRKNTDDINKKLTKGVSG